ncbi:hypothetical protein AAII07_06835 [Microvirga sp. 0TCS3.31]
MPTQRLAVRLLVASALMSSSTLVAASPSSAADTWTTTVVALPSATAVDFGQAIEIEADVDSQSGFAPTNGTSTLLARPATSTTWRAVATSSSPLTGFSDVKPRMNTEYKVAYSGYEAGSAQEDSYEPSESSAFTIEVARTISYPDGGFELKGRVKPKYGKKKIVVRVSKEQNAGYVKFKTIKTDRRGRYSLTLPRRKGTWYWSLSVRGDERYLPTSFRWKTWVS